MSNFIWSDTVGTMIPKGFTTQVVLFDCSRLRPYQVKRSFHWTWCEADGVYYRDDVDDIMRFECPKNGERGLALALGCYRRYIVRIG